MKLKNLPSLPLTPCLIYQGPGGVWCDVDVVEFSYFGAPAATPKEQLYTELVDGLRGSDPCIGSGSQVVCLSFPLKLKLLAFFSSLIKLNRKEFLFTLQDV